MKEITPYLNFNGNCREAMTFYQRCLGGDLYVITFGEGEIDAPPEARHRLLHARLTKGPTVLMASDAMPGTTYHQGTNMWLDLDCESAEEVATLYAALSAGGRGTMSPHDASWGARFAMLTDRFGVQWMLNYEKPRRP
jgi:PhnB protein